MRYIFSLLLLVCVLGNVQAQKGKKKLLNPADREQIHLYEDTLGVLSYAVVNDSFPEERFAACRMMIPLLVKSLQFGHSFEYKFDRLQSVSIQYAPDSTFRIFSWQLYVDENEYRYYGAIQMNTPELTLFPLIDRSFALEGDPEQLQLSADQWYGCVYYNLYPCKDATGPYYLLFGYDGNQFFERRKIVDVLRFVDGKPVFGSPVFRHESPNRPLFSKNRIVLEYSAAASVKCNYDPAHEKIIFDHLIPMQSPYQEGSTFVPDGSYEGYILAKGVWTHVDKLFNQVLSEPLLPEPVLNTRRKDIMGREGGK